MVWPFFVKHILSPDADQADPALPARCLTAGKPQRLRRSTTATPSPQWPGASVVLYGQDLSCTERIITPLVRAKPKFHSVTSENRVVAVAPYRTDDIRIVHQITSPRLARGVRRELGASRRHCERPGCGDLPVRQGRVLRFIAPIGSHPHRHVEHWRALLPEQGAPPNAGIESLPHWQRSGRTSHRAGERPRPGVKHIAFEQNQLWNSKAYLAGFEAIALGCLAALTHQRTIPRRALLLIIERRLPAECSARAVSAPGVSS